VAINISNRKYRIAFLCILLVSACGCSSHSNAPPPNPVGQSQQAPPSYGPAPGPAYGSPSQSTGTAAPVSPSASGTKFFEFNDIPIPPEVSVQTKNSYVFQSGQIKMGFLTLRGRVDSNSLVNFFVSAMPQQGWRLKAQFRSGRSLLIFDKSDRACVILMKEDTYYTYVELYVSPAAG